MPDETAEDFGAQLVRAIRERERRLAEQVLGWVAEPPEPQPEPERPRRAPDVPNGAQAQPQYDPDEHFGYLIASAAGLLVDPPQGRLARPTYA